MVFSAVKKKVKENALRPARSTFVALAFAAVALVPAPAACADTPAQARQAIQGICDRSAASYERRDLAGYMATRSPEWVGRNVTGRKETLRQEQTAIKNLFARNNSNTVVHSSWHDGHAVDHGAVGR